MILNTMKYELRFIFFFAGRVCCSTDDHPSASGKSFSLLPSSATMLPLRNQSQARSQAGKAVLAETPFDGEMALASRNGRGFCGNFCSVLGIFPLLSLQRSLFFLMLRLLRVDVDGIVVATDVVIAVSDVIFDVVIADSDDVIADSNVIADSDVIVTIDVVVIAIDVLIAAINAVYLLLML